MPMQLMITDAEQRRESQALTHPRNVAASHPLPHRWRATAGFSSIMNHAIAREEYATRGSRTGGATLIGRQNQCR